MPEKIDRVAYYCKSIFFAGVLVEKMNWLRQIEYSERNNEEKKSPHFKVWGHQMSIFYYCLFSAGGGGVAITSPVR